MTWDVANPELDSNKPKHKPKHTLENMPEQWAGHTREQVDALTQRMLEKEIAHDERMVQKEAVLDKKLKEVDQLLSQGKGLITRLENVEEMAS